MRSFSGTVTAENSDFYWSAVTGDGRSRAERSADKSPLVCQVLLDRLQADDTWLQLREAVERGEDPFELARAYGNGRARRRVIADMLTRRGSAIMYTVPDEPSAAGNRYSKSFWLRAIRGADCVVRLGAKQCLSCGDELAIARRESGGRAARTSRVLYCAPCWPSADEVADRDAIADVFARAAVALGHPASP